MHASMYTLSAPIFTRMLSNLDAILDKAIAHAAQRKIDPAVLMASRLFPDMLPMSRQVQVACDFAKGGVARLCGEEPPKWEDTEASLADLKARNHLLAVATGKGRRGLDEALAHSQLHAMFDATRTADQTAGKPHPLMLQELMAELGATPERTLMIGDTTHDLQLARNAGTARVAVSYGAHDTRAFVEHEPLFIAHSTQELHDWLRQHA